MYWVSNTAVGRKLTFSAHAPGQPTPMATSCGTMPLWFPSLCSATATLKKPGTSNATCRPATIRSFCGANAVFLIERDVLDRAERKRFRGGKRVPAQGATIERVNFERALSD